MKKIIASLSAILLLAGVAAFAGNSSTKKVSDCCAPGNSCCYPGSPCCNK